GWSRSRRRRGRRRDRDAGAVRSGPRPRRRRRPRRIAGTPGRRQRPATRRSHQAFLRPRREGSLILRATLRRRTGWLLLTLVGEGGLEPPSPFGHMHLKHARLPIPPLARGPTAATVMRSRRRRDYTKPGNAQAAYLAARPSTICTYQSAWL